LKGTKFLADGTPAKFEYGEWPGTFWMRGGEGHGDNPVVAPSRLKIAVQRYSLYSHGAYEISDGLTVDFDASYGRVKANNHSSRLYERNLLFQIDNAFLPAQIKQDMLDRGLSSILIGRQGDDFGDARGYGDTQTYRGQIGLKGGISGTWKWDAYYQYGRSDYRLEVRNNKNKNNFLYAIDAIETPGGTVCRALTSPDPLVLAAAAGCQPLNIIGENNWSQAGYDYAFGTAVQTQRMEQHVIAANVNGELFSTWAGPVLIAAGVEHRQDKAAASADAVGQRAGWNLGNGATFAGRIKVTEGYLEANVPLARDMAFANLLELNGAIRYADYSTSGGVTTWKVGTIWEPTASVRLRATKSRDIRAPNVLELFSAGSVSPGRVTDKPSNIDALPSVRTGGNLDLVPEVADTWTAGIVLTPDFIPNLRVSADWFDIKIDGAITSLAPQLIIDRCFQGAANLCDLITRDAAGVITFINAPLLNLNSFVTRGLDLEAAYRLDLGGTSALDFRLLGTYVKDLISTDAAGSIDRAGQTGAQSLGAQGLPKWTLNGNVVYNSGPVTLSLEGRYIPRGVYDKTLVGPQDAGYDPQLPNSIDDNRVGGRFYTNVGFQFRVPHRTHAFEFYGAIQNLFDKDPPIAPWNGIGTNGVMFDTIGRSFRVGARLKY
jgi:outer membrane receptor protein involved in Fe transport